MTNPPEGWEIRRLEDLCEPGKQAIVDGPFGSNLKRSDYVDSGIPVLKIQNIKENLITLKKMDYVSPDKYQELVRHSFTEGDIVMTKLGDPLGVSAIVNGIPNGLIVADLVRIRPSKVLIKFLCYQLNSPRIQKYINEQQKGTTRPRVNLAMIRELPIYSPPIEEQHNIVELLEDHLLRLDAALVDVRQAKLKAAQFRRSLLQAAFTGNLGSSGTGSLTEIPSDWNWVTLDEAMSECKNGLTYRNNPELAGFPVSRIETISNGEIDFQKVGYGGVSLEGNQKHLLTPGDILFSHIKSMLHVGKVAIYKSGMPALLHGMNLLRITPSDGFVPKFLFFLFQSSDVRKQIWSKAKHAVNQASINIGELKTVVVPKPPIIEQQKIVEILEDHLSRLEASVSLAEVMERQSNGLRRSLLQAAFTGQLTKEVESV